MNEKGERSKRDHTGRKSYAVAVAAKNILQIINIIILSRKISPHLCHTCCICVYVKKKGIPIAQSKFLY